MTSALWVFPSPKAGSTLPLISDRPGAREMTGIEDMILIAERLLRLNYSEKTVNDIFYGNAKAFIDRNGIKEVTK